MKQFRNTEYYVSEDGDVYSKKYHPKRNPNCEMRKLKPFLKNGYLQVAIYINGKQKFLSIHRLVAECYITNPNNKPQVNHIDGNKLNNHYINLEWVTNKENADHRDNVLNKKNIGEKCGKSILKTEDVLFIRKNYITKHPEFGTTPLSKKFNVASRTILSIVKNERWKHLI
jgi:hypothetical protein